jgi:SAM-dependent methyltransferase
LVFWLAGVRLQHLYDLRRYFRDKWLKAIPFELADYLDQISATAGLDSTEVRQRYQSIAHGVSLFDLPNLGIIYNAPCDASHTHLPPASVDVVTTSEVLEHVQPEVIPQLLREWKRILKPGGLMSHTIDLADHFQQFDQDLSPVNFLRFSERTWRCLASGLAYCNRLREGQYLEMFADAGFSVLHLESTPDPRALATLATMPLAREFAGLPAAQLAVTRLLVLAQVGS